MKQFILTTLSLLFFISPSLATPDQPITLTIKAEKEISVIENGVEVIKRVAAEGIEPGQTIIYTLNYSNKADEQATNVVFNDPVPERTRYVAQSAFGNNSEITFSVDQGNSYGALKNLKVSDATTSGKLRPAKAEDVTHIRWQVLSIEPKSNGELGFKVQVK